MGKLYNTQDIDYLSVNKKLPHFVVHESGQILHKPGDILTKDFHIKMLRLCGIEEVWLMNQEGEYKTLQEQLCDIYTDIDKLPTDFKTLYPVTKNDGAVIVSEGMSLSNEIRNKLKKMGIKTLLTGKRELEVQKPIAERYKTYLQKVKKNTILVAEDGKQDDNLTGFFSSIDCNIKHINSTEDILRNIKNEKYSLLFFECTKDQQNALKIIKYINESLHQNLSNIIVYMEKLKKEYIPDFINEGIKGIALKPLNSHKLREKIYSIVYETTYGDPGQSFRKSVRVTPEYEERAITTFRSNKNKKLIKADIKNISLGGAAIRLHNPMLIEEINLKDVIKDAILQLPYDTVYADILIIGKIRDHIGVKFIQPQEKIIRLLSEYIYKKICIT